MEGCKDGCDGLVGILPRGKDHPAGAGVVPGLEEAPGRAEAASVISRGPRPRSLHAEARFWSSLSSDHAPVLFRSSRVRPIRRQGRSVVRICLEVRPLGVRFVPTYRMCGESLTHKELRQMGSRGLGPDKPMA